MKTFSLENHSNLNRTQISVNTLNIFPHMMCTVYAEQFFTINLLESFMCANTENFYLFILFMATIYFMGYFLYSSSYEHASIFQSWAE